MTIQPRWTAAEDATLTHLWHEQPQLSTYAIAARMGRSQDSVAGRAHRIGLASRASPISPTPAPRPSRAVRVVAEASTLPPLLSERV